MELGAVLLDPVAVQNTLGLLLKYQDDMARVQGDEVMRLLQQVEQQVKQQAAEPTASPG
jgi:membrane protein involved in colicin uptake